MGARVGEGIVEAGAGRRFIGDLPLPITISGKLPLRLANTRGRDSIEGLPRPLRQRLSQSLSQTVVQNLGDTSVIASLYQTR